MHGIVTAFARILGDVIEVFVKSLLLSLERLNLFLVCYLHYISDVLLLRSFIWMSCLQQ